MLLRLDDEEIKDISVEDKKWLTDKIEELTNTYQIDGIIIQDYNKGVCVSSLNRSIISLAKSKGILVFVDPKLANYDSYNGANYFKPNLKELSEVISEEVKADDPNSVLKAVLTLKQHIDADNFIITLGSRGAYFFNSKENAVISTKSIEKADVCGAGDSFISALCLAICSGLPLKKSISFANLVSGVACQKVGVQAVRIQDIKETLKTTSNYYIGD
jgi:D-beta-D-heptose 7-phosphate kinase/D-beta-D-heptose 1-phosphate adenosyltransferase